MHVFLNRSLRSPNVTATVGFVVLFMLSVSAEISEANQVGLGSTASVQQVEANGLEFSVVTSGPEDGRAVLLLHGFPQSAAVWTDISGSLNQKGFRTIAPDLRGVSPGARPESLDAYNLQSYMNDVLAIADSMGVERFDVSGFGLGGAVAWMLAANAPDRVRSLTSLRFPHPAAFVKSVREDEEQRVAWKKIADSIDSSSVSSIEAEVESQLADNASKLRAFLSDSGLPPAELESYITRLEVPGALAGAYFFHHAISLDIFAQVPRVSVPTYFIWSKGPALTENTVKTTANYVDGDYKVEFLPDATHFLIETAADQVIDLLLAHLAKT